jgi:hypothetical protein
MRTHQQIDERSLAMARAIVAKIDSDAARVGFERARTVCDRWARGDPRSGSIREWSAILQKPWDAVREVLLDESEEGKRLRQSSPFGIVLTPQERWAIYREFEEKYAPTERCSARAFGRDRSPRPQSRQ